MSTPKPLAVTVTAVIAAAPQTIYDLISDIPSMPRYSPETVGTSWLGTADGPVVGARFRGRNAIGRTRWSTKPTITAADRGSVFAFKVPGKSGPQWTYHFEPVSGGTLVTESMAQRTISPLLVRLLQRGAGVTDRSEHLRQGMTITLERLATAAAAAEAGTRAFR